MTAYCRVLVASLVLATAAVACGQEIPNLPHAVLGEKAPGIWYFNSDKDKGENLMDKYRDKVLILFFFRTDNSASDEAVPVVNKIYKNFQKKGVDVIAFSPEKKERVEQYVKAKEMNYTFGAGGLLHLIYDIPAPPYVCLIDTQGVFTARFHALDNLEDRLQAQLQKTPPRGADPESLKKRLKQAQTLLDGNDVGRAFTIARDINGIADKESSLADNVKKLMDKATEEAKKLLSEAKKNAEAKEYDKAFKVLADLSVRFENTDLQKDVEVELSRLLGDRDLKPRVQRAKDNAKGELLNDEAADLAEVDRYIEAIERYRDVTEKYPDTEAAKKAEAAMDKLNSDPKVKVEITKRSEADEADRWLDLGDRYRRAKLYAQARDYYEKVISTHPDSRAAGKAKERLSDLPADEDSEESSEPANSEKKP